MSAFQDALATELARAQDERRRLATVAHFLEVALLQARQGVDERIVLATLTSKGVTLGEPTGAAMGSAT